MTVITQLYLINLKFTLKISVAIERRQIKCTETKWTQTTELLRITSWLLYSHFKINISIESKHIALLLLILFLAKYLLCQLYTFWCDIRANSACWYHKKSFLLVFSRLAYIHLYGCCHAPTLMFMLFWFTKNPLFFRCRIWVENCRRADLEAKTSDQLNKHYRLCAKHFDPAMVCKTVSMHMNLQLPPNVDFLSK